MRFERQCRSASHTLVYGFDGAALGWFGEVLGVGAEEKVVATYDLISRDYDHERPLRGLLLFIGECGGLFDEGELNETLERLIHQQPEELPHRLRVVAEVLANLRGAEENG